VLRRVHSASLSFRKKSFSKSRPSVGARSARSLRWLTEQQLANLFAWQESDPQSLMTVSGRTYSYFQDRFYSENDGLNADQLHALLVTRQQREQRRIGGFADPRDGCRHTGRCDHDDCVRPTGSVVDNQRGGRLPGSSGRDRELIQTAGPDAPAGRHDRPNSRMAAAADHRLARGPPSSRGRRSTEETELRCPWLAHMR
jgi:hypothetical protein